MLIIDDFDEICKEGVNGMLAFGVVIADRGEMVDS